MSQQMPTNATQEESDTRGLTPMTSLQEADLATHPTQGSRNQQMPLPRHWERLTASDGRPYYANHATRSTAWQIPVADINPRDAADSQTGLPAAWQALVDDRGRTYYANHQSHTTTFDRPEGISTGELPAGWEILRTLQGVGYFADHNTRTVTWEDPRNE